MPMKIKEEIINALEALAPQIDKNKALLELKKSAVAISHILAKSKGLDLIEYICEELRYGQLPIYTASRFLEKPQIDELIEYLYKHSEQETLDTLLLWYHQLWIYTQEVNPKEIFEVLKKLEKSKAVNSNRITSTICLDCHSVVPESHDRKCGNCGSDNIVEIHELFLSEPAKSVLKNGQYLEIYVKECMEKSGIEPIGWNSEDDGKRVYTSIKYQVEGEYIDVDALGISQPVSLILCETKTSKRINMNEIRRVENLFNRLSRRINELTNKDIPCLKLFITTGEFDNNVPVSSYQRKGWELIDRSKIPNLVEELRRFVNEI